VNEIHYAGFWVRTAASIIDSLLVLIIVLPLLSIIYGSEYWSGESLFLGFWDLMLNYILPAVAVIVFWIYKSATPGKMVLGLKIADAETGASASTGQLIGRYFAYYVSIIPLFLGFIWVAIDKRKQGWHDKLAGTIVVREQK
jgi:uncharacterized RDD family membrane protein YckC